MDTNLRPKISDVKPPSTAFSLDALIDAAVARAVDATIDRICAMQMAPPPTVVDTDGVCALLGISRPTLRDEISRGLPFIRVGSGKRFVLADVLAWYRSQRGNTP